MEKVIAKYNYAKATEETESALQDDLGDLDTSEIAEKLKLAGLKNIINIFIQKICTKEFVQNVPRSSPGSWMANMTIRDIASIVDDCIENETIPASDCYDCLFDLLLAMIRVGPGTSHYEVIEKLEEIGEMEKYLKVLKGEKLQQMVAALKQHTYTPEKNMSLEDYSSLMNSYMSRLVKLFVDDDREDVKETEIWTVFLDLYLFYLLHTKDVPEELHEALEYCGNTFWYLYDRNPYKGYPDTNVLKEHLQKLGDFILSPDFGKERQLKIATDYVEYLCDLESDQMETLWPDLMALFKKLSTSKKAGDLKKMLEKFKYIFDRFADKTVEKNPETFVAWAKNITEIMETIPDKKQLDDIVPRMVGDLEDKYKPSKGDEKYWFPLVKAIWSVPTKDMQGAVLRILKNTKLKRMWLWKENIHEAKEMIAVVENLDLPLEETEDFRQCKDSNSNCGDAVEELIEMLQIQKLDYHIMAEIGRMSMKHMENRSIYGNCMVDRFLSKTDFQKVTEVVPELVKRFEVLITDEDYPWLDNWSRAAATDMFDLFIKAYKSSQDIPDEVNQTIIRILDFCMDDDRELINIENGDTTVWGTIIEKSLLFVSKHCEGGTGEVIIPVMEKMLKFRHSDHEFLHESCTLSLTVAAHRCPEICANFFGTLLDWYIEEQLDDLMSVFFKIAPLKPDELVSRMDKFVEACTKDTETVHSQMAMFYELSTKHPEVFNQKLVDMLMEIHYNQQLVKIQVLMILNNVSKVNPNLIVKHTNRLIGEKFAPMEQYQVNGAVVNVALLDEKYKEPVFKFLMDVLKASTDDTQVTVTIIGLSDMCVKYGPDMFDPHKDYIVQRRDNQQNTNIRSQMSSLIDRLEGRSLETVAQDVKETQDDVDQLDTRVTGNEVAVGTLTTRVDQHDEDIQETGEALDTVTQRVDFAEKDIEETKIKVEEVDNKTMTNAPRWSRDLTKLMNPPDEDGHDWRLLAQRLGYSNDDIRAWAGQHDPCMAVLSDWYATHRTREANHAVLTALQEMDRMDGAAIVENAMKATVDVVEDEEVDYASPPPVFLSYQWGHQDEVKLIRNHLQMAGYECWMDIGQMGGGDKLFEKIDNGIRGAKVIICCVSEKYAKSPNCNREVNLSTSLGKPMIPLLMEKMAWPPKGSMGPIFSEYLFVRFFQRPGEETNDNRIWPVPKFQEMLMQLSCYGIKPEESLIEDMYRNWWIPVAEVIVIDKDKKKQSQSQAKQKEEKEEDQKSPDVFISYQWGKQKQIIALYKRLTGLGLSCWMDIHQMGGGDSLYEKIDSGVRGCKVVLTCITQKYSLSANCRREVSLADALKKPIIPLLLEKMDWPPSGPMSMVFTQLLFINFYRDEEVVQVTWTGPKCDELLEKIGEHVPMITQSESNKETPKNNNKEPENNTKPPPKVSNDKPATPRPVSSRGQRVGTAGPQPTENKPSPVKQSKPVPVQQNNADSTPTTASTQQKEEAPVETKKKSKSCSIL